MPINSSRQLSSIIKIAAKNASTKFLYEPGIPVGIMCYVTDLEYSSSLGPWLCKMFVLNWSGSDNRENVPMIISFF